MDVHTETIAVAYGSTAHQAEVVSLGNIGTRQRDSDKLLGQLQAKAKQLVFVYEAGPQESIGQQLAAQIPWFHNCVLLNKLKEPLEREW